jgi:hypothetical protein
LESVIFAIIARIAEAWAERDSLGFDEAVGQVWEAVRADLKKADGTDYTLAEIQIAAAAARLPWQRVLARADAELAASDPTEHAETGATAEALRSPLPPGVAPTGTGPGPGKVDE